MYVFLEFQVIFQIWENSRFHSPIMWTGSQSDLEGSKSMIKIFVKNWIKEMSPPTLFYRCLKLKFGMLQVYKTSGFQTTETLWIVFKFAWLFSPNHNVTFIIFLFLSCQDYRSISSLFIMLLKLQEHRTVIFINSFHIHSQWLAHSASKGNLCQM